MNDSDSSVDRDFTIAVRTERFGGKGTARDVRVMGAILFACAAALGLFSIYELEQGYVWPKAVFSGCAVVPIAVWWLVDAVKLSEGTRRHQKAILWVLLTVGCVSGGGLVFALLR